MSRHDSHITAGYFLFIVSDLWLGYDKFVLHGRDHYGQVGIMLTYYLAQAAITLGLPLNWQ